MRSEIGVKAASAVAVVTGEVHFGASALKRSVGADGVILVIRMRGFVFCETNLGGTAEYMLRP